MTDAPFTAIQTEALDTAAFDIERSIIEPAGGRMIVQLAASQEERAALLKDAQCVLVARAAITSDLLDQLPNLQLIVRYGVGIDTLDIPAATARGIVVAHYPDYCQPEVANHAIMLLLAVARKLLEHDRSIRAGRYRSVPLGVSAPIFGETMGIVGLGNIGRQFAQRAKALGMEVIAYDPYLGDEVFAALGVGRAARLEDLLRRADHISIHAPLTPETLRMFSDDQFALMKPTSILVNTARGPIVDQAALVNALRSHQIAGAGIDVFEVEPVPAGSPLLALENVTLTPHSAFYSERSNTRIKHLVGKTVVAFMQGRWPDEFASIPNRHDVKPRADLR
jgi:D-3-phosphoglycerate dehydrogenase / 2-oxoglutarate reductase